MDRKNLEDVLPLSPLQEGMLFHSLAQPTEGVYLNQLFCTLKGHLDERIFREAWCRVVARHQALRASFHWESLGKMMQVVHRSVDVPWRVLDASGLPPERIEGVFEDLRRRDLEQGCNLTRAPLLRFTLVRVADGRFRFLWTHHHLLLDGWSLAVVWREAFTLYAALLDGVEPRLEPARPLAEYLGWLERQDLEQAAIFWRGVLEGFTASTPLGIDHPATEVVSEPGRPESRRRLSGGLVEALEATARRHRLTFNTLLQGAWGLLLGRYSGCDDIVFGVTVSGRPPELAGMESMVGVFINTLPVRLPLAGNAPLLAFLTELQQAQIEQLQYSFTPLARIQAWSAVPNGLPLFESLLVVESYPMTEPAARQKNWHLRVSDRGSVEGTNYPLTLVAVPRGGIEVRLSRDPRRVDDRAGLRLLGHLEALLTDMTAALERGGGRRLGELSILTAAERHQSLLEWNDTERFEARQLVHDLIAEQARRTPDAVAVICEDAMLTYRELQARAARLARTLLRLGAGPESAVGVVVEPSPEVVVAVVAVLQAGGAYVPLDPEMPSARLGSLLRTAGVSVALAPAALADRLQAPGLPAVRLLRLGQDVELAAMDLLPPAVDPAHPAYQIFTSGSTGSPKGVVVSHRALANLALAFRDAFALAPGDRLLMLPPLTFDAAAGDLFPALASGATLVLHRRPAQLAGTVELESFCSTYGVTVIDIPAAFWKRWAQSLAEEGMSPPASLRLAVFGGESVPAPLVASWDRLTQGRVPLLAAYGPTEATVCATLHRSGGGSAADGSGIVPLGRPLPNVRVLLLDRHLLPVPLGVAGEVFIGGLGLARGYFGQPAATAERFVPDPLSGLPGGRLYRTGDLARRRDDGTLEFLGRMDEQIKLRGFRIEPAEIEAALAAHPRVREAVALVGQVRPGHQGLIAFFTTGEGPPPEETELRRFVDRRLPVYMRPDAYVALPQWPVTANGKVDRRKLLSEGWLAGAEATDRPGATPPRNAFEEAIAGVWREILGVERVGVDDNFFDLGGTSLLLIPLQARLRKTLGRTVPVVELLEHPTVSALAAHLSGEAAPVAGPLVSSVAREQPAGEDLSVAVIGMAGRFPGARNVDELWEILRSGTEAVSFFTSEELAATGIPPELLADSRYVRARGMLDEVDRFDAAFFGIPPHEARLMDPQHRMFLEGAWHALEDAGCDPSVERRPIGVFAGAGLNAYLFNNLLPNRELLATAGGFETMLGSEKDFLPTRISYKLDLRGPSLLVQTACSTSLVALHLACRALLARECDLAIAGGVSVTGLHKMGYLYREGGINSPDGHCRAFDALARGFVPGDGLGVVVLKRLAEARRDGDRIRAVILGSAINNDGASKVGYTAPSVKGQVEVVARAHEAAGIDPATVTYVEAHGTGTPLGDPIEVSALTQAFRRRTGGRNFCALGSIKTNVGHLDVAAGIAGLIKAVLALEHRTLPASLHFQSPNPDIDFAASPFYVNGETRPWPALDGHPRRAGVSSFGIGGTNAHVVLEEAPSVGPTAEPARPQVLVLSAATPQALERMTANLAEHLAGHPATALADAASTLQLGRRRLPFRRAVICRDRDDAIAALGAGEPSRLLTRHDEALDRPVAFLFPGQGAQHPGMARGLYAGEPLFREEVDRCAERLAPRLGFDLRRLFDGAEPESGELAARLDETSVTQPALFVLEHALARLWMSWGVTPRTMLGHSVGELVAACLAGVFTLEQGLELVALRGELMQSTPAGAMLAVRRSESEVRPLLGSVLELAAVNGEAQCVVAGPVEAVDALARRCAETDIEHRRLRTRHAFHSAAMDEVVVPFVEAVRRIQLASPRIPFLSNVTGTWIRAEEATDPRYWGLHLRRTVRFFDGLTTLVRAPRTALLEVGPGDALSKLARRHTERSSDQPIVTSLPQHGGARPELETLLDGLARLWLCGVKIDWAAVHRGEVRQRVALPGYPFDRQRYWVDAPRRRPDNVAEPVRQQAEPDAATYARPETAMAYTAPRDPLEAQLAGIWARLLGLERVGVDDDFFELGGDSLLAVRLISLVRDALAIELTSDLLLTYPSVARLARAIRELNESSAQPPRLAASPLVEIQRGTDGEPPLYLVHPVGGRVLHLLDLARALGPGQAVHGFQAPGLRPGEQPVRGVAALADLYVDALRRHRPAGPYFLAGASMGGAVAVEMARRLAAGGECIELLALLDTPHPASLSPDPPEETEILRELFGAGDQAAKDPEVRRAIEVFRANAESFAAYRPAPLTCCRLTYFRARERPVGEPAPESPWVEVAVQGIEIVVVPGGHSSMYRPPHVSALGARLGDCLGRARRLARTVDLERTA